MEFKRIFEVCRSGQTKKVLEVIRNVSFLAVILLMAIAGIYFIFGVDLALDYDHWLMQKLNEEKADQFLAVSKSKSLCLMIVILLTFGSSVLMGISENWKEKKWLVYLLKALSIIPAVVFIIFISSFEGTYLVDTFFTDKTWISNVNEVAFIKLLSTIFVYIGFAGATINVVSNVLLGIEE